MDHNIKKASTTEPLPINAFDSLPNIKLFLKNITLDESRNELMRFFLKFINAGSYAKYQVEMFDKEKTLLSNLANLIKENPHQNLDQAQSFDKYALEKIFGADYGKQGNAGFLLLSQRIALGDFFSSPQTKNAMLCCQNGFLDKIFHNYPQLDLKFIIGMKEGLIEEIFSDKAIARLIKDSSLTLEQAASFNSQILKFVNEHAEIENFIRSKSLDLEKIAKLHSKNALDNFDLINCLGSNIISIDKLDKITQHSKYFYRNNNELCKELGGLKLVLEMTEESLNSHISEIASNPNHPLKIQALIYQSALQRNYDQLKLELEKFLETSPNPSQYSSLPQQLATTFGFEVEYFGISNELEKILRTILHDKAWTSTTDSSVISDDLTNGLEAVTPILKTHEELISALKIVNLLKACGARTNDSCGLHVHLGITNQLIPEGKSTHRPERFAGVHLSNTDLQLEIIKDFILHYYLSAGTIINGSLRQYNQHSKDVIFDSVIKYINDADEDLSSLKFTKHKDDIDNIKSAINPLIKYATMAEEKGGPYGAKQSQKDQQIDIRDKTIDRIRKAKNIAELQSIVNFDINIFASNISNPSCNYNASRTFKVNLLALDKHKTIEIREHDGTVDAKQIASWITLLDKIMDSAIEGVIAKNQVKQKKFDSAKEALIIEEIDGSFAAEVRKAANEFAKQTTPATSLQKKNMDQKQVSHLSEGKTDDVRFA